MICDANKGSWFEQSIAITSFLIIFAISVTNGVWMRIRILSMMLARKCTLLATIQFQTITRFPMDICAWRERL